jgi:hypothetical protein
MIQLRNPTRGLKVKGTIIDFETTGNLDRSFYSPDPRYFGDVKPTIFGYLVEDLMVQYCAESFDEIEDLIDIVFETIPTLDEPYYALNTAFERHLLSRYCNLTPVFVDVRGIGVMASKRWLRDRLDLPHYGDPFNCSGLECKINWDNGNFEKCIVHNQACLQLERDILEIRMFEPSRYPF